MSALETARRLLLGKEESAMNHRMFKTAQLGLVIAAAAVLAACSSATSAQTVPAWTPPLSRPLSGPDWESMAASGT